MSFTLKDIEDFIKQQDAQKRPREYTILVGSRSMNYMNAIVKGDTEAVDKISAEIRAEATERHNKHLPEFIANYGQAVADIVMQWERPERRELWLAYKAPNDLFSITLTDNSEEEEYTALHFYRGEFSLVYDTYSGYGSKVLESNLTIEQVLEKLKTKHKP